MRLPGFLSAALIALTGVTAGADTEQFQGTYAHGLHVLRIHQVGVRICGEWEFATESKNREGLIAGVVANGAISLTECEDFELKCKPEGPTPSNRFRLRNSNLERILGSGDGSAEVFVLASKAKPRWTNAQAEEAQGFLSLCNW